MTPQIWVVGLTNWDGDTVYYAAFDTYKEARAYGNSISDQYTAQLDILNVDDYTKRENV